MESTQHALPDLSSTTTSMQSQESGPTEDVDMAPDTPKTPQKNKAKHEPKTPKKKKTDKSQSGKPGSSPKAKAKSKVSAKAKAGSTLKKPASVMKTLMKKPAALKTQSQNSKKKTIPQAKVTEKPEELVEDTHELGEEEAVQAQDPILEDPPGSPEVPQQTELTKDRSKSNKFMKLLAQGSLPPWLVQAWEGTKQMKTGRSAAQRQIVNDALTRTAHGSLHLDLEKPSLQQHKDSCFQFFIT